MGVWHMDQDPGTSQILDSSSYLNHGTATNMDVTNLQSGQAGDGLYFDGSVLPNAEYIRVPSNGTDELSISGASPQLTLEAWVRRTGTPTNEWMVTVGRQIGTSFQDGYTLATVYNAPDVASLITNDGVTSSRVDSSALAVPFDEWRYLTGVRAGDSMTVYSNGLPVGSNTAVSPMVTDINDVTIGAAENDTSADTGDAWRGLLDEIRISDVARSADWVNAQHASMTDTLATYGSEEEAGVLVNDTDPELDPMTTSLATGPSHADAFSLNADGSFTYTPVAGMSGTDTFTYVANDGTGDSNVATVTITVTATGPNNPPVAVDDPSAATTQDVAVVIDVLANDTDPDPDTLTVNSVTQGTNGAVVNNGTDVTYTPSASWTGIDTFTYEASDGNGGFDTATVTVTVSAGPCADSDSDGLCDLEEDANTDLDNDPATIPGPNTDGDANPNYLDADDDDDGTPTASENADPNGDGDPRDAVDSDRDGQPDYLDDPTGASTGLVGSEQKISHLEGGLPAVLGDNDRFGSDVVAIGDLDGDGINDIAVGALFDDDGGTDRGAVYVLFLNANGTVKGEQKISFATGGFTGPLDDNDYFGSGCRVTWRCRRRRHQ